MPRKEHDASYPTLTWILFRSTIEETPRLGHVNLKMPNLPWELNFDLLPIFFESESYLVENLQGGDQRFLKKHPIPIFANGPTYQQGKSFKFF